MPHYFLGLMCLLLMLPAGFDCQARQKPDREQWEAQMRQYKRAYFTKELDLSREQQNKFFPLYEEMEETTAKIADEARTMERRLAEAKDVTDLEYEKATDAIYDAQVQQAQIEREYLEQFRGILSRRQLFMLKGVERQFARDMLRQHSRLRSKRAADKADTPAD